MIGRLESEWEAPGAHWLIEEVDDGYQATFVCDTFSTSPHPVSTIPRTAIILDERLTDMAENSFDLLDSKTQTAVMDMFKTQPDMCPNPAGVLHYLFRDRGQWEFHVNRLGYDWRVFSMVDPWGSAEVNSEVFLFNETELIHGRYEQNRKGFVENGFWFTDFLSKPINFLGAVSRWEERNVVFGSDTLDFLDGFEPLRSFVFSQKMTL